MQKASRSSAEIATSTDAKGRSRIAKRKRFKMIKSSAATHASQRVSPCQPSKCPAKCPAKQNAVLCWRRLLQVLYGLGKHLHGKEPLLEHSPHAAEDWTLELVEART